MYDEIVKRLHRYTENCVAYKLDADFADAVQKAADAIEELNRTHDESAAYQRGLDDAWEAARKIVDSRNFTELSSAFDGGNDETGGFTVRTPYYVIQNYTAAEALARIRAYEEAQKIHVGDEVTIKPNNKKGVVLECHVPDICNEDKYSVLCGNMTEFVVKRWITKTGRHFPEVAALLDKMKGDADESD